jgi:hypothetical protein
MQKSLNGFPDERRTEPNMSRNGLHGILHGSVRALPSTAPSGRGGTPPSSGRSTDTPPTPSSDGPSGPSARWPNVPAGPSRSTGGRCGTERRHPEAEAQFALQTHFSARTGERAIRVGSLRCSTGARVRPRDALGPGLRSPPAARANVRRKLAPRGRGHYVSPTS